LSGYRLEFELELVIDFELEFPGDAFVENNGSRLADAVPGAFFQNKALMQLGFGVEIDAVDALGCALAVEHKRAFAKGAAGKSVVYDARIFKRFSEQRVIPDNREGFSTLVFFDAFDEYVPRINLGHVGGQILLECARNSADHRHDKNTEGDRASEQKAALFLPVKVAQRDFW